MIYVDLGYISLSWIIFALVGGAIAMWEKRQRKDKYECEACGSWVGSVCLSEKRCSDCCCCGKEDEEWTNAA